MELDEFKRRLMIDPHDRAADMQAARLRGGEDFRCAAEDADLFEDQLERTLSVPAPDGLAEQIVARRGRQSTRPKALIGLAAAASVVLAIILGVILLRTPPAPNDIADYLAWRWAQDGELALTLLEDEVPEAQLASIATQFNLELGPTLWGQVRFIKLCPAPDGQGAHLVLATEAGPVTLFYLPGLEGGNGEQFRIDGMHAWVADLETGALVVIASPEQPLEQFASLVRDEFRVNEL